MKWGNLIEDLFHRTCLLNVALFGKEVSKKIFRNQPTRNKNCLWWPCLLTDRDDDLPSIDASYQVSVHLAKRFQSRRFKGEKLTDDRCQMMARAPMAFRQIFDIFSSDVISLICVLTTYRFNVIGKQYSLSISDSSSSNSIFSSTCSRYLCM